MDHTLRHKVQDIAEDVHYWAQELARKRGSIDDVDLNGFCAIASAELHKRLIADSIEAEIHLAAQECGSCHVFVVVDDYVVDPTAMQFRKFRNVLVLIEHQRELAEHWFYQTSTVFRDAKTLRKTQLRTGWVQHQVALAR